MLLVRNSVPSVDRKPPARGHGGGTGTGRLSDALWDLAPLK